MSNMSQILAPWDAPPVIVPTIENAKPTIRLKCWHLEMLHGWLFPSCLPCLTYLKCWYLPWHAPQVIVPTVNSCLTCPSCLTCLKCWHREMLHRCLFPSSVSNESRPMVSREKLSLNIVHCQSILLWMLYTVIEYCALSLNIVSCHWILWILYTVLHWLSFHWTLHTVMGIRELRRREVV